MITTSKKKYDHKHATEHMINKASATISGIKEYSELFCAEGIPESCNDFFLDFMEPKEYFGLNNNELIELTQHFCFWLYLNKYTHSYLTLI